MNVLALLFTIISGTIQIGEDSVVHDIANDQKCITSERITRPTLGWKVISTELSPKDKELFMVVSLHNPLNKTNINSLDARFILQVDSRTLADSSKYNLANATFYNKKTNVTFNRVYTVHQIHVKKGLKQFPIQTPCFARQIDNIIQMDDIIIRPQSSLKNGDRK
jgi:hypothetical protein